MAGKNEQKPTPKPKQQEEEEKEEEETEQQPGQWDDVNDMFEGEDEGVVASAKARILADKIRDRRKKAAEDAEKEAKKKKKSNAFL